MNVDLNEICTNLVPFPRLQFLMTALSPQRATTGSNTVHDGAFVSGSGSNSINASTIHNSGSSGAASGSKNGMQVCPLSYYPHTYTPSRYDLLSIPLELYILSIVYSTLHHYHVITHRLPSLFKEFLMFLYLLTYTLSN